jgi:hypothetical protein
MTPNNTAPSNKCHYRSCAVVGSNVPSRLICYALGCDRVFHSYCYDLGVLRKDERHVVEFANDLAVPLKRHPLLLLDSSQLIADVIGLGL